jgi:tRNA A-37 threonylcarbamoyl transferase component Bud32
MTATSHSIGLPDRYRLTRRIAGGGMATVYACEDQVLGRLVAVKVLSPGLAADPNARARFQREARAVARVSDHPHVVTIYDIGDSEGQAFITMEYFPGGTVSDRLKSGTPVPLPTVVRWLDEAASALDHAHAAGIVHRDVKPANLLLDGNGRLAVGDFGIARMATDSGMTATGTVLGTAAYLSPEQALGESATAASDRYALAVVAFELLTGQRPFAGEHVAAQARAHVEAQPPRASALDPALPPAVDHVLLRGLEKDPDRRWPTACAMSEALEDALGDEAEPVRATARTAVLGAPARPRRWPAVLAAVLAAGAIAGVAIAALGGGGDNQTAATPPRTAAKTTTAAKRTTPAATPPAQAATTQAAAPAANDKSALGQRGHALLAGGDANAAIPVLQQAVQDCPVSTTDPCAYALYDLGHALRIAGRPAEAVPVLQQRLQNPNQQGVVQTELEAAQAEAAGKPGKGPKKTKKGHGEGD